MAEPARNYEPDEEHVYDPGESSPDNPIRPNLTVIPGGGESTDEHGNLSEVKNGEENAGTTDNKQSSTGALGSQALKAVEGEAGAAPASDIIGEGFNDEEEDNRINTRGLINSQRRLSTGKKAAFGIAGLAGIGITVVLVAIFLLIGWLKYIHFATVLRSIGFARFTYQMSQEYSQTIFDTAVLDPAATGSFSRDLLGDRSMLDVIRGINPEQQLIDLGRSGEVKFNFSGEKDWLGRTTNTFEGVNIGGADYSLNETAQKLYGGTYDSLALNPIKSFRVRAEASSSVRDALSKDLSLESRDLVESLKGIQTAFGIKLYGVVNGGRDFVDKITTQQKDAEAAKENYEATQGDAVGSGIGASESSDLNTESQNTKDAVNAALDKGQVPDVPAIIGNNSTTSGVAGAAQDAKKVAGGVLIATLYCTLRDLDQSAGKIDQANQANAVRQAAHIQSMSDQIKAGDVTTAAVDGETDSLGNPESASLYAADTGQTVTGTPADLQSLPSINSSGHFAPGGNVDRIYQDVTNIINLGVNKVPIVGNATNFIDNQLCSVILNPTAQITAAVAEIIVDIGSDGSEGAAADTLSQAFSQGLDQILAGEATGQLITQGSKFAITYGSLSYLGNTLSSYIQKLSGLDYSGLAQNGDLYNQAHVGTSYMAQASSRTVGYGRPLSNDEAAQSQAIAMNNLKQTNTQSGLYNRYFAMSNPFSLMGSIVAGVPTSLPDIASQISTAIPRLISKIGDFLLNPSLLINLFGGKNALAAASESIDQQHGYFGVQQWGWSPAEMQTIQTDPSYALVANANYVESPSNYQRLKDAYNKCFQSVMQNIPGDPSTTPSDCAADYLSTPDALHWRKYMWDKYTAGQLAGDTAPGNYSAGTP